MLTVVLNIISREFNSMHPTISPLSIRAGCLLTVLTLTATGSAAEYKINGHTLTTPDEFQVELVAGQPLVDRPVSADFDERGRLYVTDSSGSNEPVEVQREKRPHRIVRLEDTDRDGKFDRSTVFADKLMFPEGALWFDGSLYVAAPPEIWKFTDVDDDGVADKREVWFDGKTLTHCANDLHGPYLGPDGWMYWCKGAFATQTYELPGQQPLTTRAAHIFRRRPQGGPLEPVMTGGMDNPVEVVFTPGGERIFSTTFLVRPRQGQRDGLLHAAYGGVYGKDHGAIDGHPRTGELMPVLAHLGAAAPCGLARLESDGLGSEYQDSVLACLFNLHKITRHVLSPRGATFVAETSDLLVSDNLDFHPTDVLEDADGSVIVVDTGGWFRLCCPTSQLEKPDVLGGIYRIRRLAAKPPADPRGQQINWSQLGTGELVELLNDERFTVRNQARQRIGKRGRAAVDALASVLSTSQDARHRLQAVWALTWINDAAARTAVRRALNDSDDTVRQAALHSTSVYRDKLAASQLAEMLKSGSAHNRRAAAEALGRIGTASDVPKLLAAIPATATVPGTSRTRFDRFLEHSLIYAAIEINEPLALREVIDAPLERVQRGALIALDQLEGDQLQASDVAQLLTSRSKLLSETAWWIAERHEDWGDAVVEAFRSEIERSPTREGELQLLSQRLQQFASAAGVQQLMADLLQYPGTSEPLRLAVLQAMAASNPKQPPAAWVSTLSDQLSGSNETKLAALQALSQLIRSQPDDNTVSRLRQVAADEKLTPEIRLRSLNLLPRESDRLAADSFDFVCSQLRLDASVTNRALAVDLLTSTPLSPQQLQAVARELPSTGPMELRPLMTVFSKSRDVRVGTVLVDSLLQAPAATSLFPDDVREQLSGFGEQVSASAQPLLDRIRQENQDKLARVEEVLALLPAADSRRGLRVFQSTKASCIACHTRGYLGGHIGPDLNRIGTIRSERDLIESVLFPNLSFVRSFEPVTIVTDDGRLLNGVVRDESEDWITLQLDAQKSVQIEKANIEERRLGSVSIMPAGLEKQLAPQDLADLVKYLKEG